jgi:hypothetical protein
LTRARRNACVLTLLASILAPSPARADDDACVAASEQVLVLRKRGKLIEALQPLATCTDHACPDEVRAVCMKRLESVTNATPSLVFAFKDAAGNDKTQVEVRMDGALLTSKLDGRAISVDPGEHVFEFRAAGEPPVQKTVLVGEGEHAREIAVVVETAAAPSVAAAPVGAAAPVASSSWSAQKTVAIVSGATGVVALLTGVGFAAIASSKWSSSQSECSSSTNCLQPGPAKQDHDTASTLQTASLVAFGLAGAGLVAGTVLWFTAQPPAASSSRTGLALAPWIPLSGLGQTGIELRGSFQ